MAAMIKSLNPFSLLSSALKRKHEDPAKDSDERASETLTMDWDVTLGIENPLLFVAGKNIQREAKWQLFMPEVIDPKTEVKYYGLFLRLAPSNLQPPCFGEMQVVKAKFLAELRSPLQGQDNIKLEAEEKDFKTIPNWGRSRFVESKDIDRFKFDGKQLKLKLTLTIYGSPKKLKADTEQNSLGPEEKKRKEYKQQVFDKCTDDIFNFITMADKSCTDVIIKTTDQQELHVHKLVLAARSNYFRKMVEDKAIHELSVKQPHDVMKIIVCHMCTGILDDRLLDPKQTPKDLAMGILKAAEEYDLQDMAGFIKQYYPV